MVQLKNRSRKSSEYKTRFLEAVAQQIEAIPEDDLRLTRDESPEAAARRFVATRRVHNEWDQTVGPFFDTAGAMAWLGYRSRMNITDAVKRGDLLAVPVGQRRLYPRFQFSESGQPLPQLREVTAALAPQMGSPWTQALWLNTPVPAFGGKTPAQMLQHGRTETVLRLARADAGRRAS